MQTSKLTKRLCIGLALLFTGTAMLAGYLRTA
jgi:hypothetical protein